MAYEYKGERFDFFNLNGIETYADLLAHISSGRFKFGTVSTYRDGMQVWDPVLWADENYIHWHHFGSSANKKTPRDMQFVIEEIFKMSLPQFLTSFVEVFS